MHGFIYRAHVWLGMIVAVPLLAWTTSGLLYSLPNRVEGGKVETITQASIRITPEDAMRRANEHARRELPLTALTLLMRDGRPVYQAVGGMGAESLLIDAETGAVTNTPPPNLTTRYFRQAHFYYFAGAWQVPFLILLSTLATLSAASGIYLNIMWWKRRMKTRAGGRPSPT